MTPPDPIAALRLAGPPRLVTLPTPALDWPPPHEQAWARLCAQNPRLHDGPIWAVAHADAAEIAVYPDRYKRLSIQADPAVGDLGIRQLGVKGLSVAPGADGRPRLLLARRGPRVRTYPRLWETAPAGGVTLPGPLTHTSIIDALSAEAREELGLPQPAPHEAARFLALIFDRAAQSVDLLLHTPWTGPAPQDWSLPRAREAVWEYAETRWVPLVELPSLLKPPDRDDLSPPTRWILDNARDLLAS